MWFQLSLIDECLGWVERARTALTTLADPDDQRRMQLHAAVAWPEMFASAGGDEGASAVTTTLRLAERLGNTDYQLRALWAL